jgi:solute carrier family 40 (iron-regulated transporter), member 1
VITISLPQKMLLARLLTRSGDQAWDFAVPLALLNVFPGELSLAALYYFLMRLAVVAFLPRLASIIDQTSRPNAVRLGILLQLIGVIVGALAIYSLSLSEFHLPLRNNVPLSLPFLALVLGGALSSLGSSFMDVAIANDLVPASFAKKNLANFNSRLRQVDLITEVAAPIAAGTLLLTATPANPLLGFFLVALWNISSFFPEYGLLTSIFRDRPDLASEKISMPTQARSGFLGKIASGWRSFFRQPIAPASLAYALLWLSALSPHGVLLTAFLKDGWNLPEWAIGTFRGLGAIFGLLATIAFPVLIRRLGLIRGSQAFLAFQAATLTLALVAFFSGGAGGQFAFLGFILLSRIGLYGVSMGEMQIRQVGVQPDIRGEVNGFATALTGIATLGLYGAGALLPGTEEFSFLVVGSICFVILSLVIFSCWARGRVHEESFAGK